MATGEVGQCGQHVQLHAGKVFKQEHVNVINRHRKTAVKNVTWMVGMEWKNYKVENAVLINAQVGFFLLFCYASYKRLLSWLWNVTRKLSFIFWYLPNHWLRKGPSKTNRCKIGTDRIFDFILPSKFSKIVQNLPGYNKILSTYKPKQITSCCFWI